MQILGADLSSITAFGIGFVLLTALWLHIRFNRRAAAMGPTLLTTLGILFCFLGIALGLLDFDVNDIGGAVPQLIDGIRTAFWVSVVGIATAVSIKFRVFLLGDPPVVPATGAAGASLADVASLLYKLNASIAGSEDSTLLSQTKLLRQDNNDRNDKLQQSFERFAEKMAEANSKALIQALSEVIKDFNQKLTEQFGENFKQLNQAVEKLVVWQENYKEQMTTLIYQETQTRKAMTESSLRYAELVNKSTVFVSVSESLDRLLLGLDVQRQDLDNSLRALSGLVEKAGTGIPKIEEKILEMTRQIESGVRANNDLLGATMKTVAGSLQTAQGEMSKLVTEGIKKANDEVGSHIKQMSEETKNQVVALDAALERELTRSIEGLGRQLAALSQKFVEDYQPLTDSLRRVVEIARKV